MLNNLDLKGRELISEIGYSVVSMLYQSTTNGIDAHYGKAVLCLTQAYCFNWMYFEIDGSNLHVHAIRRHKWTAMTWNMCKSCFRS